jgi:isocitrate/isopropylmalate dehydrogenase
MLTKNGARTYKIASIPGDGIGVEVIAQAIKVLRAIEALLNSFT